MKRKPIDNLVAFADFSRDQAKQYLGMLDADTVEALGAVKTGDECRAILNHVADAAAAAAVLEVGDVPAVAEAATDAPE